MFHEVEKALLLVHPLLVPSSTFSPIETNAFPLPIFPSDFSFRTSEKSGTLSMFFFALLFIGMVDHRDDG